MKENTKKTIISGLVLSLIIVTLISSISYFYVQENYDDLKQVLYFEQLELDIADESSEIYDYYSLSSNAYDIHNFEDTIYYCEQSRKISSKYSQKLREIKSSYPGNAQEILKVREKMIEKEIEYLFALYQSCEYLESAARAYDNEEYASGDINIEGQNEQIKIHDDTIEEYYNLNADYQILKKEMLK